MKMKTKKILLLFTILVLVAGQLIGCSMTGKEPGSSAVQESPTASPSSSPTPTPSPTPSPSPSPTPTPLIYDGGLELPVNGATGYTSVSLNLRKDASTESESLTVLDAGQGFTILKEQGDWWQVNIDGITGWVYHPYCLINLPDVLPSIVYNDTNAYASKMISSGTDIPNITGKQLYEAYEFNPRLNKEAYIVPVLYSMAKVIYKAQQNALKEGDTLIIYEGFRPYDVQQSIVSNLSSLAEVNEVVKTGITAAPWSIEWFIATGVSNHQQGYAIDVSLGKVEHQTQCVSGDYGYTIVDAYTEYDMPTVMHELSRAAASMSSPVASHDENAWRNVSPAETMNEKALLLRQYCTDAGLTPLASEWWHFNDLKSADAVSSTKSNGKYYTTKCYSVAP